MLYIQSFLILILEILCYKIFYETFAERRWKGRIWDNIVIVGLMGAGFLVSNFVKQNLVLKTMQGNIVPVCGIDQESSGKERYSFAERYGMVKIYFFPGIFYMYTVGNDQCGGRDEKSEGRGNLCYYCNRPGRNEYCSFYLIDTNHVLVNAIINTKYQEAVDKDILFIVKIGDLSDLRMSDEDIVIILSNLLSNAIEACEKSEKCCSGKDRCNKGCVYKQ